MKRLEVSKILFYIVCITGVLGLSFAFGIYSAAKKTAVYEAVRVLKNRIEGSVNLVFQEVSTLTKTRPTHFLQPSRYNGEGVTVNEVTSGEEELILMAGFFNKDNEIRLIHRDGSIVNRWSVRFSEIFADTSHFLDPPTTDWNVDTHGVVALEDGSVLFNFENYGLVKLTKDCEIAWTLTHRNHHTIERAEGGGFWVPGRRFIAKKSKSPYPPFKPPFFDDLIMKISENGEVIYEISVAKLFYENNLESLLTLTGGATPRPVLAWMYGGINLETKELFHLNDIEELHSAIANDFPMFEAGDLALSMRNRNLIAVFNPKTLKIKWWKIGPWVRQHDVDFQAGGTMTVFNNNRDGTPTGTAFGGSNIVKINPATGDYDIIYGAEPGQRMHTNIRGKHQFLSGGRLLITEHEGGRVFEVNKEGRIIWEYINRYDSDEVAEITDARIYSADYFNVSDWSCE